MSNTIATDAITGGWAAVWKTLEMMKASVSTLDKMLYRATLHGSVNFFW